MLRVLLFCLFYLSQGQGDKLQGKINIDHSLASVFHEIINQYLNDNTKNVNTEININKLVDSIQKFANPSKQSYVLVDNQDYINKNMKMENINVEIDRGDNPINTHGEDVKAAKHISLHLSKAKKNKRNRRSTVAVKDREDRREKKIKMKNKGVREEKERKKAEIKDAGRENEKKEHKIDADKGLKEKTILEEIIGLEHSVHVYGKHKGNKHGLPLNNIKA